MIAGGLWFEISRMSTEELEGYALALCYAVQIDPDRYKSDLDLVCSALNGRLQSASFVALSAEVPE